MIYPQKNAGGKHMTVQKDLEKALAAAESAKGTYATFAASTDDQKAQQMFTQMSQNMEQHISTIEDRLNSNTSVGLSSGNASSVANSNSSATAANQQD
jgi:bacterioferritin (cytochrome b1)